MREKMNCFPYTRIIWVISFLIFSLVKESFAITYISNDITSDQVWNIEGSPYVLNAYVTISPGVTLTITPGTVVLGAGSDLGYEYGLRVYGVLHADGVIFTGDGDPEYGTGGTANSPGEWGGIRFENGSNGWVNFSP